MSEYTEQKKIKSLWRPITDDDFDIDLAFRFCCLVMKEASLS